jgi:hypothetical protein
LPEILLLSPPLLTRLKGECYRSRSWQQSGPKRSCQQTETTAVSGAVAQLGERLNGIQEVVGSIPIGSTRFDID